MKGFITWVVLWILGALVQGWVMSIIWNWFLVKSLGLPILTPLPAIGITYTIRYLVVGGISISLMPKEPLKGDALLYSMGVFGIGYPLLVLFFGWLYHLLIG